jgi:hypothetical protein
MFPKKGFKYPFASSPTKTGPDETGNVDGILLAERNLSTPFTNGLILSA